MAAGDRLPLVRGAEVQKWSPQCLWGRLLCRPTPLFFKDVSILLLFPPPSGAPSISSLPGVALLCFLWMFVPQKELLPDIRTSVSSKIPSYCLGIYRNDKYEHKKKPAIIITPPTPPSHLPGWPSHMYQKRCRETGMLLVVQNGASPHDP